MSEPPPPRRQQDHRTARPETLYRFEKRFRLEHHSRAAAVRVVVDRGVTVVGKVAQLHQPVVHQTRHRGSPRNARGEIRRDDLGKERYHIDCEHWSAFV
jgi:hypothetical protein